MASPHGPSTRSVHGGPKSSRPSAPVTTPLVLNAAYAYPDVESWRAAALGETEGHIYSRNTNPTVIEFEHRMADLEGAEKGIAFASGMAAISNTLFALLSPGDRAVSVRDAYGATYLHFTEILPRFGIECAVCPTEDHDAIEAEIAKGCKLVYLESPTNPTLKVLDIARLAAAAKKVGAVVVVDNTFATPLNQSPIALGADLVVHSATKFIGGHSDVLAGTLCGGADLVGKAYHFRELTGAALDPHSAWLMLRSLKTLAIRIDRQNENAMTVARYLEKHPKVAAVNYPGLESHPGHAIAAKQMRGFGGMLSFELSGGVEAVNRVLPKLALAYLAANLGQVETIAGPPSTTSHVECTAEERAAAGIPEGLIRYSVGIEDAKDLVADLEQALEHA